jgi:starch-binding outer membrane protein, SusD/RagB family
MKTKIFKHCMIILTLSLGILSCEKDKDFLMEKPHTFYTLENGFTSPAQVDAALINCYKQARDLFLHGPAEPRNFLKGKGTDIADVPFLRLNTSAHDYSHFNPQSAVYNTIYSGFFRIISNANTVLYGADQEQISWESEDQKNELIAQAKFFRAFAYMNLGQLYGGVPIVEEVIFYPKTDFVRSTRIETYQFAIDDLESVLDYLPETVVEGGRIVKGAAQNFLCELYLSLGIELEAQGQSGVAMYDKAIQYANDVIDGGTFSLMTERFGTRKDEVCTYAGTADVFWDLFQEGNQHRNAGNTETIMLFNVSFEAYKNGDNQSLSRWIDDFTPVFRAFPGMEKKIKPETGGYGIAWMMPLMYMREIIWENPVGENDMRNAEHNIRRNFYYDDPKQPDLYGKLIPYEAYFEDDWNTLGWPIWYKVNTDKYTGVEEGYSSYRWLFRDEYVVRLAETILMRAELYFRKGELQNAADDLNLIRDRAQCSYRATPADVNIDFILDERARELFGEERRWNTLLRMGDNIAVDRIKKYEWWGFAESSIWDFNLWPIPQDVIDRNIDAVIEQNPGWTQF